MSIIDEAAKAVVSGYETVATGEGEALRGYWNIGCEVRYVVDNRLSFDSFLTAIKAKDSKGYAKRRGGHSKPNLSKAGKLVKTWKTYENMTDVLKTAGLPFSFEVAYEHAVKVSGSGGGRGTPDEVEVEFKRVKKMTAAKRRKFIAKLRAEFPNDFS